MPALVVEAGLCPQLVPCHHANLKPPTPISAEKTMKMPDPPVYVVYTDSELEQWCVVSTFHCSAMERKRTKFQRSYVPDLYGTQSLSMVAILRASAMGKEVKYPSKLEMRAMSQKIVDYFPMLRDADANMPYVSTIFSILLNQNCGQVCKKTKNVSNILSPQLTIYTKMYKRLQNMRSPRKRQGSVPQRGAVKTALFSADNQHMETDTDTRTDTGSSSDTILLESSEDISEDNSSAGVQIVGKKMKRCTHTTFFCLKMFNHVMISDIVVHTC